MATLEWWLVANSKWLHSIASFLPQKKTEVSLCFLLLRDRIVSPSLLCIDYVYTFLSHTPLLVVGLMWLLELMKFPWGKMGFEEEVRSLQIHSFHNSNTDVVTQIGTLNVCFLYSCGTNHLQLPYISSGTALYSQCCFWTQKSGCIMASMNCQGPCHKEWQESKKMKLIRKAKEYQSQMHWMWRSREQIRS